jgi:murein DD-endopeptidase MepM/ murein hydrolase activator NlpD
MRKIAPIFVILAALGLYAARDAVFGPLTPANRAGRAAVGPDAAVQTATVQESPLSSATGITADVGGQDTPQTVMAGPAAAPSTEPVSGRIKKNSSLYIGLREAGVSPVDIDRIVRAAKPVYNLKRVRAGQRFDVYPSGAGNVDSMFFYYARDEYLGVRQVAPGNYTATIDTVPYTVSYLVTEGTISQSVFATLQEQDAQTDLAAQMADVFGWTIDFFTDIRSGDSFAVLYEQKEFEDGRKQLGEMLAARVVSRGREYYAFRFGVGGGRTGYYNETGASMEKSLRRSPVKYTRVTSNFSFRRYHPISKRYQPHYGVDFGAPYGTPVYATGDGTVVTATRRSGNGNYVKIKHNNTYTTYYLHLQRFARGIRQGRHVRQGQVIGYVGSTGWANGPHVCYRVKKNGSWVNPRKLRLPSKEPVVRSRMASFERYRDACLIRLNESILDGVDNRTILVERPWYPSDGQMTSAF